MLNLSVSNMGCTKARIIGMAFMQNIPVFALYTTRHLKQCKCIGANLGLSSTVATMSGNLSGGQYISSRLIFGQGQEYRTKYYRDIWNHDTIIIGASMNKSIGKEYLVTREKTKDFDLMNLILSQSSLPLKIEWMPYLSKELANMGYLHSTEDVNALKIAPDGMVYNYRSWIKYSDGIVYEPGASLPMWEEGKMVSVPFSELIVYRYNCPENVLEDIVSKGLREGHIVMSENPLPIKKLALESYDEYNLKYHEELVKKLDEKVVPIERDNFNMAAALKQKRLLPAQRTTANAVGSGFRNGRDFALFICEMGTGKTIMSLTAIENFYVNEWLRKHPGASKKDAYSSGEIKYRCICTGPGHVTEKWADEARNEIPDLEVISIKGIEDFVKIREAGKERKGKQLYVISKDSLKLGSAISPTPQMVRYKEPALHVCSDCLSETKKIVYKKAIGNCRCSECGGTKWTRKEVGSKMQGLLCPYCNELLLKPMVPVFRGNMDQEERLKAVMRPEDFANKTEMTNYCYHCGMSLWGTDSKNVGVVKPRKRKWRKISHYVNYQKKSKKTAWVYTEKGKDGSMPFLERYLSFANVPDKEYTFLPDEAGVRKVAPAEYIKKYLKGYFDMCILDECHKFENGGSAQTIAAAACVRASKYTVGLTGTIANGKADSFFWLFWMLMPRKMRELGYRYNSKSMMRFVRKYGSVVEEYEKKEMRSGGYNSNSRGKMLSSPKIAPGISPLLFVDFMIDSCVFLNMSDLADMLPELKEEVVSCSMPQELFVSYRDCIGSMREAMRSEGKRMAAAMLMFALSYPDMPFAQKPIMSPSKKDELICRPLNFDELYAHALLPKEAEMVRIVNQEISEGRNCFIFGSFTGDNSPLPRWKSIIEKNCNLNGRVAILDTGSATASKREAWIRKKASEGIKVFLCNPKLVETGLDFCFHYEGTFYDYPTLLFMQTTYELAVLWQASHRHYRLNQPEECRTFWLTYGGSMQMEALALMAEKIVAVSAIQGKFSSGALAAMAKGVDARLKLAQALKSGVQKSDDEVLELFNKASGGVVKKTSEVTVPDMETYWEVMGINPDDFLNVAVPMGDLMSEAAEVEDTFFGGFESFFALDDSIFGTFAEEAEKTEPLEDEPFLFEESEPLDYPISELFGLGETKMPSVGLITEEDRAVFAVKGTDKKGRGHKKYSPGQMSILDMFG